MINKLKNLGSMIMKNAPKYSSILGGIVMTIAIIDINSTCALLIGQPEMFEGYEKYKKYV